MERSWDVRQANESAHSWKSFSVGERFRRTPEAAVGIKLQ